MNSIPNHLLDRRSRDAEHLCKLGISIRAGFVKTTHLFRLFKGELGLTLWSSTLFNHVLGIVLRRAKKEMLGVNAVSNVASVKHKNSFWNWPSKKLPRKSTCLMVSRLFSTIFVGIKDSVPVSGKGAIPKPAGIFARLVNLAYKPLVNVFAFHGHAEVMPQVTMIGNGSF